MFLASIRSSRGSEKVTFSRRPETSIGAVAPSARSPSRTSRTSISGAEAPAVTPSYGLGIAADPDGAQGPEYCHGGGGPGWNLRATHWTDFCGPALSMAVLSNHDAEAAWEITIALADAAMGALQ